MKRHRVLVTGVGGNIGQGILKALRASRYPFYIVGVDMKPLSAGFSLVDRYKTLPRTGSQEYEEQFKAIARQEPLEAVYISSPNELEYFSTHQEELKEEFGFKIFVNPPEVCRIGRDKFQTAEFLKNAGFPYPRTVLATDKEGVARLVQECGFPLILKPRQGFTSFNVFLVNSLKQIEAASLLVPDLVLQEYLPEGEGEFTAGTVSGPDQKVRAGIVLKRELFQGTTYRTELMEDPEILREVVRVVEALGAVGVCNVQFRRVEGKAVIFEINPRFSGTSGVRYLYGFNDPEMMFELFCLNCEPEPPRLHPAVVLRYWNEIYLEGATFESLKKENSRHHGNQTVIRDSQAENQTLHVQAPSSQNHLAK